MTRVVGIAASRRAGSYSRVAVGHALDAARAAGAETGLIDLGDVDLPLYHPDRDERGESDRLRRRVRAADGVVIGTPVYHSSSSSTFKSFHDYCSCDEFEDTAVGLLAVAGGDTCGSTLDHLRSTVRGVHGWVVPLQVGISGAADEFVDGELVDDDLAERTARLGRDVADHAARLRD